MKRELRACLADAFYIDADMDNAHFRLLLDECEGRGIACTNIRHYVEKRVEILKELMEVHEIGRDDAKQAFIAVLFAEDGADPYRAFIAEFRLRYDEKTATLINDLFEEAKSIRKQILEQELANGIDWAQRTNKDHKGAQFAVFMQTKCTIALGVLVQSPSIASGLSLGLRGHLVSFTMT